MNDFPHRIPIFPLAVVLFPGQYKSLRIFETRYRRMLHDCLDDAMSFGIVYADPLQKNTQDLPSYHTGVLVDIHRIEALDDGSIGIEVSANERFRAEYVQSSKPYLEADITLFPLQRNDSNHTSFLQQQVALKLAHYLHVLTEASGIQFEVYDIPEDAEDLAYLTGMVLQINNQQKQGLLAQSQLNDLLQRELDYLTSELNLMAWINQTISHDRHRGFGIDRWMHVN